MRTYRLPLVGLVLLVLSTLVQVSSAAAPDGIGLRGRVSAYVDITIPSTVTINPADIQIRSSGRFAGFYLLPDTSTRPTVGALYLPRWNSDEHAHVMLGKDWTVYPGGYRLYLLAERPAEVYVPIPGIPGRTYSPTRRADVRLHMADFTAGPADQAAERRFRLKLRGKRTLVAAAQLATSTSLTGVDHVRTCVTAASVECPDPLFVRNVRAPASAARIWSTALPPAGTYDAVFRVERAPGIHGDTVVAATALTLAL